MSRRPARLNVMQVRPPRRRVAARARLRLLAAAMIAAVTPLSAQTPQQGDPVGRVIGNEARKLQDFVVGPRYHEWPAPATSDCAQIYEEIVRLTPYTYNYKPDFYDDPRNAALGLLGLVYPQAFYVWGYTALDNYSEGRTIADTRMHIDSLRRASARQDCWVRE
jgi:hypothetical protein